MTPLPPLIYLCCREAVRAVPWERVFEASGTSMKEQTDDANICRTWKDDYEPEAGIINFVSEKSHSGEYGLTDVLGTPVSTSRYVDGAYRSI